MVSNKSGKEHRKTLSDVAREVGVTKMTVSRFLKDPSTVAKATGEKIKKAIDELGFVPNRAPVMLRRAESRTIGLAVSSFSNLLFSDLIDGVENTAREYGYEVLISHTSYKVEEEERKIEQLLSYQVDAIILTEPHHSDLTIRRLKQSNIPVVELMSLIDSPIDINVGYNHEKVSYLAVKGLIESGRKNIAYMRARLDQRTIDRQHGYEIALQEAGLKTHVFGSNEPSNFSRGADMMRKALNDVPELDAVYCTNDDVAIGAMIACVEKGISIPDDISVLGYNGLNIGTATSPKLSSIVTNRYQMGCTAVEKILISLKDKGFLDRYKDDKIFQHFEKVEELCPMLSLGETIKVNERESISKLFNSFFAQRVPKLNHYSDHDTYSSDE